MATLSSPDLQDLIVALARNAGLAAFVVVLYAQLGQAASCRPGLRRATLGAVLGLAAVACMSMPVSVQPGVIVDGRTVFLALAGPFAGGLGTAVAFTVAACYRWYLGGQGWMPGIVAIAAAASSGLLLSAALRRTGRPFRFGHLFLLGAITSGLVILSFLLSFSLTSSWSRAVSVAGAIGPPLGLASLVGTPVLGGLLYQEQARATLEHRLAESEAQYRLLAEHSTDMISLLGPDLNRQYVSPASMRLLGYAPAELCRMALADYVHPDDLPELRNVRSLLTGTLDHATVLCRLRHKDGHWVWAEGSLSKRVDPATGEVRIISIVRDIGERKAVEEALAAASRAKSQFLANMSHELRTPLNAVIGFADMMKQETYGPHGHPKYGEYVGLIGDSGRHLLRLINEVLDLSKIEADRMELAETTFAVGDLIGDCVEMLAGRAETARVAIHMAADPAVSGLFGDALRLRQAVLNLLSNAVKFTPAGGAVRIRTAIDANGQLVVTIRDNGCGIAAADMEKLFQPFGQANSLVARQVEGTGLGLILARRLVELHGGRLWLESEPGVGTTACFTLPPSRVRSADGMPARSAA